MNKTPCFFIELILQRESYIIWFLITYLFIIIYYYVHLSEIKICNQVKLIGLFIIINDHKIQHDNITTRVIFNFNA